MPTNGIQARAALRDLRVLWRTRRSSGLPWPHYTGLRHVLLGYPAWSPVPVWRQLLRWPLRPYRYCRMVRSVAQVRNRPYAPALYDEVP